MAVFRTIKGVLVFAVSFGLTACFIKPVTKPDADTPVVDPAVPLVSKAKMRKQARSSEPKPLNVAVLDPESFTEAKSRHRKSLASDASNVMDGRDVGYYMDIQQARLRQQIGDGGITISRELNNIVLSVPGGAMFGSNSFFLRSNVQQLLAPIASVLVEYNKTQVSIYGHTDDVGEENYNQQLSEKRAMSVARFLVEAGVARQRIVIIGYGESLPLVSNADAEGRKQNRRVELQLVPIAQ